MNKRTTELINKVLGEESEKTNKIKKTFTTGQDIKKECEEIEHIIERDGEGAFMEAVGRIIQARESNRGVHAESAGDTGPAEPTA